MRIDSRSRQMLAVASFVLMAAAASARADEVRGGGATVTEFNVPTGAARPYSITAGPDGYVWFTESNANKIGRITPSTGRIGERPLPTAGATPYGIATGSDGNIWFTERFADQIGRISLSTHQITEFPIQTAFAQPWDITAGPDGALWFTEEDVHQIGRITIGGFVQEYPVGIFGFPTGIAAGADGNTWFTIEIGDMIGRINPAGQITTFPYSKNQTLPWDITPGPDGNMWFSELAGRAIGRITPAGAVTEFPIPGEFSGIAGVATGWDGNIWYTENDTDHVGSMAPDGTVLPKLNTGSRPIGITAGPDGNMWYAVADGNKIGRVNIAAPNTGYVLSMDGGFSPPRRTVKIGDTVKWMFVGPRQHSVFHSAGCVFFDSDPKSTVSYFSHTFQHASTYAYQDDVGGFLTGEINVPVSLPASGTVGQPFTVTWSTPPGLPLICTSEVQVRVPGSTEFTPWVFGGMSAQYTPTTEGEYAFRARILGETSQTEFSQPAKIVVE